LAANGIRRLDMKSLIRITIYAAATIACTILNPLAGLLVGIFLAMNWCADKKDSERFHLD